MKRVTWSVGVAGLWLASAAGAQLPAFPGAEGYGSETPGGRGGRVIEVTTLAPSGPGSLREAAGASGPRIIVFRVGGWITLTERLYVSEPFVTIAGQTAPGDGIAVRGADLIIQTHDVIMRGMRLRSGDLPEGPNPSNRNSLMIWDSQDVVVDHCSIGWAVDQNVGTHNDQNFTISWTLISEGLHDSIHEKGPHSMGLLLYDDGRTTRRFSLHHSIFAHHNQRNPRVQGQPELELINNIIYDWGSIGMQISPGTVGPTMNIISNLAKPGPSTSGSTWIRLDGAAPETIFVEGNIGPGRDTDSDPEWGIVRGDQSAQRMKAWPAAPIPVTITPHPEFVEDVLSCVGAVAPRRDAIDARVVQQVRDGTGRIIDAPSDVGGWPELAGGTAPDDSDHDGIPDAWESARGLDPSDIADGNATAPSGYTWVEEYVNSLFGDCSASGRAPPVAPPAGGAGGSDAGASGQTPPEMPRAGAGAAGAAGVPGPTAGAQAGGPAAGAAAGVGALPGVNVPTKTEDDEASGCSAASSAGRTSWTALLPLLLALIGPARARSRGRGSRRNHAPASTRCVPGCMKTDA